MYEKIYLYNFKEKSAPKHDHTIYIKARFYFTPFYVKSFIYLIEYSKSS